MPRLLGLTAPRALEPQYDRLTLPERESSLLKKNARERHLLPAVRSRAAIGYDEPMAPPRRASVVALVSGGPDSAVMLDRLARRYARVVPVYVRFGLRWEPAELAALRKFLKAARLPRLAPLIVTRHPIADVYGAHWSVTGRGVPGWRSADDRMELPGRNLLLLTRGALLCARERIHDLAVGSLRTNHFADASAGFRRLLGRAASLGLGWRVRPVVPLGRMDKARVLRLGRRLPLHLTLSCVAPRRGRPCHRCNKCAERIRSFRAAGLA